MAMYIMQVPMVLIGSSIGQVFVSKAPAAFREGRLRDFTLSVLWNLIKFGALPIVIFSAAFPFVASSILGHQWGRTGQLVVWIAPWMILQFITGPISMVLHITGSQRIALMIQTAGLLIRVLGVYFTSLVAKSFLAETFAISGVIFYSIYLYVVVRCTRGSPEGGTPALAIAEQSVPLSSSRG